MEPITKLSGMLDAPAFAEGTDAFGTKVSEEYTQIINKQGEVVDGLNEVAVDQIADEAAIATNTADIATNVADIADHETRIGLNEGFVGDHDGRIVVNESDILALQGATAVGVTTVTSDIASFDHATYGGFGIINLDSPGSKRTVNMGSPVSEGWSEGARVYFVCSANYGALLDSAYFHPSGAYAYANMATGDVIMATVVEHSGNLRWNVALMPKASSMNNLLLMSGNYTLDTGLEYTMFQNNTANSYTLTLPAISDSMIGTKLTLAQNNLSGDITVGGSGDSILNITGTTSATFRVRATNDAAVVTMTAMNGIWVASRL